MFVIGTASNELISKATSSILNENSNEEHFLLLKSGRKVCLERGKDFSIIHFDVSKLDESEIRKYKEYIKKNETLVVQNSFRLIDYLSIYEALLKYRKKITAFFPDGSTQLLTSYRIICFKLNHHFKFFVSKIVLFLIRLIACFPLSKKFQKRIVSALLICFWKTLTQELFIKEKLVRVLDRYQGINNPRKGSLPNPRILIFSFSGIGNAILQTSIVKKLKNGFPLSQICVYVDKSRGSGDVWRFNPDIDQVIEIDLAEFSLFQRIKLITGYKKSNIGIIPIACGLSLTCFISFFYGCNEIICHDLTNNSLNRIFTTKSLKYNFESHESINNANLVNEYSDDSEKYSSVIHIPKQISEWREAFYKKNYLHQEFLIGFHAGCFKGFEIKQWDPLKFAEVAGRLKERYRAKILLFGTKQEALNNQIIAKHLNSDFIDLTGKLSLIQTASLISECKLFISNDSGLMHIASAFSIPLVVLFGATDDVKNGPLNDNAIVLRAKKSCSPCYNGLTKFNKNCIQKECIENIQADDVEKAAEKLLNR